MDHSSEKYRLHPSVFFRKYGSNVVLYQTQMQKVYSFNESSEDVLNCFHEWNSIENALANLKSIYCVEDIEEFETDIIDFIGELSEKGILELAFTQIEKSDDLEAEVAANTAATKRLCSATFELTYRCNEKCRHCYVAASDKTELTTEKVLSVLDELADYNVLNIVFTGGELFTRKDIWDILEYAYKKRFVIDIFTNGSLLTADDVLRLKAIWPRSVHFSVYSHIPQKHDAITQIKGSFEKTIRTLKRCKLIGIPVNIKTPIFNETIDDVEGITELAHSLGATIELGDNITPKKNGDTAPLSMKIIDEKSAQDVRRTIHSLISSETGEFLERDKSRICGAGDRAVSINPYGEVFPCNLLQLKIGDLTKQSVKDIWEHSEQLNWWRENNLRVRKKGCEECEYAERCIFCPGEAMMRSGDPLRKYDAACTATYYAVKQNDGKGGPESEEVY